MCRLCLRSTLALQEFTKVETIQTPEARSKLNRPDIDQGDSHATCVAGKAVGKEFGVAKEATLVVVKLDSIRHWEQVAGYKMIRDDLASHPERHGKSVVVVSIAYDPALPNQQPEVTMKQYIQDIMNFDVPVVIAAGNAAEEGRFLVDNVPALFEGPDFPMIVVGSVTPNGEVTSFSQRGDHVSVYAVGQPISCLGMDGPDPIQESGTSFCMFLFLCVPQDLLPLQYQETSSSLRFTTPPSFYLIPYSLTACC